MSVQQDQDTTRAGARGLKALQTFQLPCLVEGGEADKAFGRTLIAAWQADGIFQVQATLKQQAATERAVDASRAFFRRPLREKAAHVSDLTYSGYVASGEEETAGEKDGSEIFTVCPDIAANDARVIGQWPCHGPVPWPSAGYASAMKDYMGVAGDIGHRLLQLTALGLELDDMEHFTRLTENGWHHMRVLGYVSQSAYRQRHACRTLAQRHRGARGIGRYRKSALTGAGQPGARAERLGMPTEVIGIRESRCAEHPAMNGIRDDVAWWCRS